MMATRRTLRRRTLLIGGSLTAAGVVLGGAGAATYGIGYATADQSTAGNLDFTKQLYIPPIDDGTEQDDGSIRYDLTLASGQSDILPGKSTTTWGANGTILGPTLRARRGETVRVAVRNDLPEATTMHWHGMHLPAVMDGGPHQMIEPGDDWSPVWAVDQAAATLWYHPHPHGATASHVYRGIAGMFIIEDDASLNSGLPNDYGVDDIPLILQDRSFDDGGQLDTSSGLIRTITGSGNVGHLGDTLLVNGTWDPFLDVTTTSLRLRLLNGSGARSYNLGLTDGRPMALVATDNGLLPEPVQCERLMLSPGERAEVVVTFEPGESVTLRSFQQDLGGGRSDRFWGGDDVFEVLQFRAAAMLSDNGPLPLDLPGTPVEAAIPVPADVQVRTLILDGHNRLSDQEMDLRRIDQVVPAGAIEIWSVTSDDVMHTFHIHGASYRVLDIDGNPPAPHLVGLKDTVFVPASSTVRLAVAFGEFVDPATPYMYHCHLLEHEDNGMMGQFVIVTPGTEASTPLILPDHGSMAHMSH